MAKGFFTQGFVVLLDESVSIYQVESALDAFDIRKQVEANEHWEFGGPTLILAHRPECNGMVAVDIVDERWPDHMGDPKEESLLFATWSMGHFGPLTFPGGLGRAAQQSWSWDDGKTIPSRYRGFIRIRYSYAFGAKDDAPIIPKEYDPLQELKYVTEVALALLELPGALCYFNPNGELLLNREGLQEKLQQAESLEIPPLDAWTNVRLFSMEPNWSLMDTVGNGQFDICDCEAFFDSDAYDLGKVAWFLRNASLYLFQNGEIIEDGDTMDGPGDIRWQARSFENGVCPPPRRVLRWLPLDGSEFPKEILGQTDNQ